MTKPALNTPIKARCIAGQNGGSPVLLNPVQNEYYETIFSLARSGNYSAMIVEKEIRSLASGHFKPNVFVHSQQRSGDMNDMIMILPGCKAYIRKRSDGSYLVYHTEMDVNYDKLQASHRKPGLFNVQKEDDNEWFTKFKPNGQVTAAPIPVVTVSDGWDDIGLAARDCSYHLRESKMTGIDCVDDHGFDMHYTPGNKIGGWQPIKKARHAATNADLHESAQLLAHTMETAQNTKDVRWISQAGGSGVLTQAMQILANKGVTFDNEMRHYVYFSHLTTNLTNAQTLAKKIGMNFSTHTHKINKFNLNELVGGVCVLGDIRAGYRRVHCDKDYGYLEYGVDLLKGGNANWEYVSLTRAAPIALSAAVTAGGTAGVYPAVFAAVTAAAALGNALFKAWLPAPYRRLTSKINR